MPSRFFAERRREDRTAMRPIRRSRLPRSYASSTPGVTPLPRSSVFFAFRHEAVLGGAGERLAVLADSLALTRILLAFLDEAGFGGAGERLAVFAHGLGLTGLRECRTDGEGSNQSSQ